MNFRLITIIKEVNYQFSLIDYIDVIILVLKLMTHSNLVLLGTELYNNKMFIDQRTY